MELPSAEEQVQLQSIPYPVGKLRGGTCGLPDISIFFVHYKTFEDAKKKWDERFQRINYDNLFFLMDRGMDAKDEILDGFHSLPGKNKVFFTHRKDPVRWPCTFQLSYYTPEKYVEALMYRGKRKGLREYLILDEFDFVQWLNDGTIQHNPIFD